MQYLNRVRSDRPATKTIQVDLLCRAKPEAASKDVRALEGLEDVLQLGSAVLVSTCCVYQQAVLSGFFFFFVEKPGSPWTIRNHKPRDNSEDKRDNTL